MKSYYQLHKKERLAYQSNYNRKHKGKITRYQKRYQKQYYEEHKGKITRYQKRYQKQYYEEHKGEITRYQKRYQKQYREEHKGKITKYQKRYNEEHKGKIRRYQKRRVKERVYKEVGELLKSALENIGENQSWLAGKLGIPRQSVYTYFRGFYFPKDVKKKEKICRVLRIRYKDLEDLLEDKNN